jgi:hypothetical protein
MTPPPPPPPPPAPSWHDLPDGILVSVFERIHGEPRGRETLLRCLRVCRGWRDDARRVLLRDDGDSGRRAADGSRAFKLAPSSTALEGPRGGGVDGSSVDGGSARAMRGDAIDEESVEEDTEACSKRRRVSADGGGGGGGATRDAETTMAEMDDAVAVDGDVDGSVQGVAVETGDASDDATTAAGGGGGGGGFFAKTLGTLRRRFGGSERKSAR